VFDCAAANEPGYRVQAAVYAVDVEGMVEPKAEIDEVVWVDPVALPDLPFAPLTRDHVLPLAVSQAQLFGQIEGE
jgi:8-oxo-dGTP diphosphatase